ncbi:uncharacterized protein EI90DRAFT_3135779 [Cantharellus anzutake]|uniref:uncharacterized protein n=1 Tax=Cantharellus anzutake TaxID=1750568 RepID=UPI0019054AE3|nr:uncharacterized protein EI90DRAFT_3135779 [Cantharellus anzutake]KAF8314811.1 hypothetical protein EI90DRAFT_3135779 [Cantharellus anzutake]
MGAILIAEQPLSIAAWDAILSPFLNSSIRDTLVEVAPLLLGVLHSDTPIRIIHQLFCEFLTGQIGPESLDHRYLLDMTRANATMAPCCTEILNKDLCHMEGLGLIKYLRQRDDLPQIPCEVLSEQLRYSCRYIVYHLNKVQEPLEVLSGLVHTFLNQHVTCWAEVCVRTDGYISVSSFPEWAKLSVDRNSKKDIHKLIQVLDEVRRNLAFFSRFQEAHELAKDSITLCRCLVSADSESYTPDLAQSLNGLFVSLDDLGHHSEALPVIEESMKLWHKLVAVDPTLYTPYLAQSLHNLYVSLENLGRYSEVHLVIEESVKLRRALVAVDRTSYTPNLARSLHNLSVSLHHLGHHSEVLPVTEESVRLWRELVALWYELVAIHPTSYTPDLARSLHSLSISLENLGHHSKALLVIEESVKLWHELVTIHPTSYTPDLAQSLTSLKISLDHLGRYSEALPVIEESVKLWHELVAVHPTSYTPNLAQSLNSLKMALDNLGHYSEALPVIKRSVNLWRELVAAHPTSYNSVPFIKESISLWCPLHITLPTSYAADLAWALRDLSRILSRLGHYAEAFDIEEEARLCSHQLRSEYPDIYANYLRGLYACMAAPLEGLGRGHELADIRTLMQNL